MCLLTGSRVGEVRQARFEQFNLELGSWSKPATTTKQRKIHRIPISAEVAAIVRQRQLVVPKGNPWLFPGDVPGQPVKEIRRFWINMQKEARLPEVRIHDLRHTFASLLVSGGASLEMIGEDSIRKPFMTFRVQLLSVKPQSKVKFKGGTQTRPKSAVVSSRGNGQIQACRKFIACRAFLTGIPRKGCDIVSQSARCE